jgi:hypothetical protein
MRSFSTFKTLFFASVVVFCASCSSSNGGDSTSTDPATVVADGQAACHAFCQRIVDYRDAHPTECSASTTTVDICMNNMCLPVNTGTQACANAFAVLYTCKSNPATPLSCAIEKRPVAQGCTNESTAFNAACP